MPGSQTRFHLLLPLIAVLALAVPVAAGARPVTLAWDANTEPQVAGYALLYGTRSGTYSATVDVGNRTSWTLNLADDEDYYFVVRAYTATGLQSPDSGEVALPGVPHRVRVESPAGAGTVGQPFDVTGWAVDLSAPAGTGIDAIQIWAYPNPGSGRPPIFLGAAQYGAGRPDIATRFGSRFGPSGYGMAVGGLPPGPYQIAVFGRSTVTGVFKATAVIATVLTGPIMSVDRPTPNELVWPIFTVAGWAADLRATAGTGVDAVRIYAYPDPGSGKPAILLGQASYGGARPDVGSLFGSRFTNSAYGLAVGSLAPGTYDIVTYARSKVTNSYDNARTTRITLGPLVTIDTPAVNAALPGTFRVAGWGVDLRADGGTGIDAVHVWAYPRAGGAPTFLGVASYGITRADVGSWLGARFQPSGYRLDVSGLPSGDYDIAVFGHSTFTNGFAAAQLAPVRVQ